MNTTQITRNEIETLVVTDGATRLEYSVKTDSRIHAISDGKVQTRTAKGARQIASEARAWGVTAQAIGHAVVFWI